MKMVVPAPTAAGAAVFDIADPDRHGKVISAGPQQSEVRFDDGVSRIVSNVHLHPVTNDGLSQHNPSPVSDVVRLGQEAMARKRRGWEDWLAIAEALEVGRANVLRALHSNVAHGAVSRRPWATGSSLTGSRRSTRAHEAACAIASNTKPRLRRGALG